MEDPLSTPELAELPGPDSLAVEVAQQRVLARLLGEPVAPKRVGRFVLERELGSGGMGSVWLALDEHLERSIALKFLRGGSAGADDERRMLAEAQGLAKLSHPNVIPVYDAGRSEGRVWIAMEFVPGRTLRQWILDEQPSAREILAAWLDAGRGLAAVHAAGLVHRDVKPDNVMMGADERVRLLDFGLVRGLSPAATPATVGGSGVTAEGEATRTRARGSSGGSFAGTPAYAAPEQLAGLPLDARADQYAFCVSLWEGLCGRRPGRGELAAPRGLSRRVHRALRRGLAERPEARFPDMDGLLRALAPPRRRGLVPAALAGVAVSAALATRVLAPPPLPEPCASADAALDAPELAQSLERSLARLDVHGPVLAEGLRAWNDRWRASAQASCEAVHVERALPESSLAPRTYCLERGLGELELLLAQIEAGTPARALGKLLAELEDPALCLSEAILARADGAPAPAQRELVERWARELDRLRLGVGVGELGTRRQAAEAAHAEIERVDYTPLRGQSLLLLAKLALERGAAGLARARYGQALDLALGDDLLLASDALLGLHDVALELDFDLAEASWLEARLAHALAQLPEARSRRALLLRATASRSSLGGALDEGAAALERALTIYAELGPAMNAARAETLRQLALLESQRGARARAAKLGEQARELDEWGGPGAPAQRGRTLLSEGLTSLEAGHFELARAQLLEAIERLRDEQDGGGLDLGNAHVALSSLYASRGELELAADQARVADAVLRAAGGPRSFDRLYALSALGNVEFHRGQHEAARAAFARALWLAEQHLELDAPLLASCRANLGEALHALGRPREAERLLRQALISLEGAFESGSEDLAIPRRALAAILHERGELDQAQELLELALEGLVPGSLELAEARWQLARVLAELGETAAGRREAERARELFASMNDKAARGDEIAKWLATNP